MHYKLEGTYEQAFLYLDALPGTSEHLRNGG